MKVLMFPHAQGMTGTSGIDQVVQHYFKYLPDYGVELVEPNATSYDLTAAHAGCVTDADIAHNHGLYFSADYVANDAEWKTNANVVESIRHARAVTVPSRWVAETFQRDMHFTPNVVPHGIDWKEWQHDVPCQGYVLWAKNRSSDVCGPDIVRDLALFFPEVTFVTTFAPPNSPPNVKVIGRIPHAEMKKMVQQAGVYLATTKETFGIGILEAMASGVPVLGYARGGILDLVYHKVSGYLATPDDLDDLKMGLFYCFAHRRELGTAGKTASSSFTWGRVAEQVARIYERALIDQPPTASIVIPTYNYSAQVGNAIYSAVQQTYPHLTDIIVIDDGSSDKGATEAIVKTFTEKDKRVRYVRQDNAGVANARNHGIALSNSKYICCVDADDQIAPSFLATLIPPLEKDRTLGISYSSIMRVQRGRIAKHDTGWPNGFNFDEQLNGHNQVPTCCVFRREMWQRLGGYRQRYAPKGAGAEDAEFWLRAGANGWGATHATKDPLFIYSFGTGFVSGNHHYHEPDWRGWHPWVLDKQHPFASLATPEHFSHPVRQYDEPLVSIIIPCGPGHAHLLVDALDSLEAQTERKWEVIVVNDSGAPLDLHAYPYVRLVETEGKKGAGYARNRGIEISRANLFICLDADDFLQPQAIAEFLSAHRDDPDAWIYSDMYISHPDGIIERYNAEDWNVETLWRKGIAPVTCLYTKEQWLTVNGYDEQNAREDWEFHLRLARAGLCGIRIPEPLFTYRHGTGRRRDEGSIKHEALKLRETYSKEELTEMCKGCGKPKSQKQAAHKAAPIPSNWEKRDVPQEIVYVEYIGESKIDFTVRPKGTRRTYVFNRNNNNRIRGMLANDAAQILKLSYFRKAQPPSETPTQILQAPPAPPKPSDLIMPTYQLEEINPSKPEPESKPALVAVPIPVAQPVVPEVSTTDTVVPPVVATVQDEPAPIAPLFARPVVEVPNITELRVMELMARTSEFSKEQWAAMLHDEENRTDGILPRATIVNWCKKQLK